MAGNAEIDRVLQSAADAGEVPGVVALAATEREETYAAAFGRRDLSRPDPITVDTVFWIASMTKAIVSAAAMQMVEQGKVGLDQDLGEILPALRAPKVLEGWDASGAPRLRPARAPVTLRHLLTHTAGFSYDMWNADIARYQEQFAVPGIISCQEAALATPLIADPGTKWEYGINIDFAGKLVEKLSGQKLDAYLQDHIFAPLGMSDTGFKIRPDQRRRLATMHARLADGTLDPIAFEVPQEPEFHMGGGGLYSTGRDYLAFTRMILNGGRHGENAILRPETVALMSRNAMGEINVTRMVTVSAQSSNDAEFFPGMVKKWSLGFMVNTEDAPCGRSAGSLAWAGLGNTYFWIDPVRRVTGVILTQILPFADPVVLRLFDAFESEVYRSAPRAQAA